MKLLMRSYDETHTSLIRHLLEDKGIPVYLKPLRAPTRSGYGMSLGTQVYVCLDSQFTDAVALLKNENHAVANPVDPADYHEWETAQPLSNYLVWGGAAAVAAVAVFVTLAFWLTRTFGGA